jgi:hypothetical protein
MNLGLLNAHGMHPGHCRCGRKGPYALTPTGLCPDCDQQSVNDIQAENDRKWKAWRAGQVLTPDDPARRLCRSTWSAAWLKQEGLFTCPPFYSRNFDPGSPDVD